LKLSFFTQKLKIVKQIIGPYNGPEIDKVLCSRMVCNDPKLMALEKVLETRLRHVLLDASQKDRRELYKIAYNQIFDSVQKRNSAGVVQQSTDIHAINETIRKMNKSFLPKIVGKKGKCLEVGCGNGLFSFTLALVGNNVIGTDASETQINMARDYCSILGALKNLKFIEMNALELDFSSNCFDCVISRDVVEHLHPEDFSTHLQEVKRVLKPNGMYIIITPNRFSGHNIPLHLNEFSYADLFEILKKSGYGEIKSTLFHPSYFPCTVLISPSIKIALEKLNSIFKMSTLVYFSLGLEPVCIVAHKTAANYAT
jgi:2-polyprenyl-3-methyl-5-hydroxy-6-metoxy-1,4-benzoquinol methylase